MHIRPPRPKHLITSLHASPRRSGALLLALRGGGGAVGGSSKPDVRRGKVGDEQPGADDEQRRVDEVGVARPARGEEVGEGEGGRREGGEGAEVAAGGAGEVVEGAGGGVGVGEGEEGGDGQGGEGVGRALGESVGLGWGENGVCCGGDGRDVIGERRGWATYSQESQRHGADKLEGRDTSLSHFCGRSRGSSSGGLVGRREKAWC